MKKIPDSHTRDGGRGTKSEKREKKKKVKMKVSGKSVFKIKEIIDKKK